MTTRRLKLLDLEQSQNLCSWAVGSLESALLGARKGEIEWALAQSEMASKTLRRAKKLMPQKPASK